MSNDEGEESTVLREALVEVIGAGAMLAELCGEKTIGDELELLALEIAAAPTRRIPDLASAVEIAFERLQERAAGRRTA